MKIKKAIPSTTHYPKKEHLKPILLSMSVALSLSACTQVPNTEQPKEEIITQENPQQSNEKNSSIKFPEHIAGGMPAYIPEQNNTKEIIPFPVKKQ